MVIAARLIFSPGTFCERMVLQASVDDGSTSF